MSLIDAHAHLTHDENDALPAMLKRANEAGIMAIFNICTGLDDLKRGLALASTSVHPKVFTIASLTPHDAAQDDKDFFEEIKKQALDGKLIAIGETGLDYYYQHAPKERQIASLIRYSTLASEAALPLVIHCRDAFDDLCTVLEGSKIKDRVMLHCFTGTLDEAKRALDRGWYISLSGIVTFPKSISLQEVAKFVPLDRLLIETDSPFLAPQGYRGQKNEPAFLVETAKTVASLKGISFEDFAQATSQNAKRLFHVLS